MKAVGTKGKWKTNGPRRDSRERIYRWTWRAWKTVMGLRIPEWRVHGKYYFFYNCFTPPPTSSYTQANYFRYLILDFLSPVILWPHRQHCAFSTVKGHGSTISVTPSWNLYYHLDESQMATQHRSCQALLSLTAVPWVLPHWTLLIVS